MTSYENGGAPGTERLAADDAINSEAYWSRRFATDWDTLGGTEQSRFFYQLALDNMPDWLLTMIRTEKSTICDWGCATGDGTDLLAQVLQTTIVGVDFSDKAIEIARKRYKKPAFLAANFLDDDSAEPPRYEIVFTSNTLEHFVDPWQTLNKIAQRATQVLVVLIPYREYSRHHEHESTFDKNNIPVDIPGGFRLLHSSVVDTRAHTPCYWNGDQILLVYAQPSTVERLGLTLAAVDIGTAATTELAREISGLKHRLDSISVRLEESRAAEGTLQLDLQALRLEADSLRNEAASVAAAHAEAQRVAVEAQRVAAEAQRVAAEAHRETQVKTITIARLRAELKASTAKVLEQREVLIDAEAVASDLKQHAEAHADEAVGLRARIEVLEHDSRTKHAHIQDQARLIEAIHFSRSWRMTAPVRAASLAAQSGVGGTKSLARWSYRNAPVPAGIKRRVRNLLLGTPAPAPESSDGAFPAAPSDKSFASAGSDSLVPPVSGVRDVPDVFVWAIIDWHFRFQRPQHIARGLARRGARVFYFSNNFIDSPEPGYRIETLPGPEPISIVYLNVAGSPAIYTGAPSAQTDAALSASLAVLLRDAAPRAIVSLVQHPFWTSFADKVPNRHLVYDMMDYHEGFGDGAPDILELEERILREADQVVVTSDFLEKIARDKNASVELIRNACEYQHFSTRPSEVFADPQGRRIIGYYGAIAHWFDVDLVAKLARRFPDDLVLLVGADSVGVADQLRPYSNVRFTGEVPYSTLPFYLYAFDVCLLPFRVIPLTLATNPVKVYEYLSAGKAVICVDLPEVAQFQNLVAVGRNHDEFLDQVDRALAQPPQANEEQARRLFASRQTWDDRAAALTQATKAFRPPRVSVVVVTYNKLSLTHACLQSLEANTQYANWEIIVVDNASQDGTGDYLRLWADRGKDRIVILNEDNRGFSAGNNQGVARASGDFVVLLNNDTYVTPGWLGTLVQHLKRNTALGLVGPVTNSIGNEARIEIAYDGMADMEQAARRYTSTHMGKLYPMPTTAFFCVAFSRAVYDQIGPLDEVFGIGMFEDDDYSRRVAQAGFEIACAEDVFVHHHHSASFDLMGATSKAALFLANKDLYERKWGPWIPHTYR